MLDKLRKRTKEILEAGGGQDILSRSVDYLIVSLIILNVIAIILESVPSIYAGNKALFFWFEAFSVAIFTIEYVFRVWSSIELDYVDQRRPIYSRLKFMCSPLILIDLLSILPFYLSFYFAFDLRFLRVLRLLRIFKLTRYSKAMNTLLNVLREETSALGASAFILLILLILASSGIYLLEHKHQPQVFGSIPAAMWWAMVTLTTVGYGDVTPITPLGKVFGAIIALIGVGMVALPTGIIASGFANAFRRKRESFEQELDNALEDGEIDNEESIALEKIQDELGLSDEEAEQILQSSLQRYKQEIKACPKCGFHFTPPNHKN